MNWHRLFRQLDRIERRLIELTKTEIKMAIDLTKLTAEVTNNTTVEASVVALLQQLTAIIKAIPPSTDPTTQAALDQLTATLATNDQALAAAVTANTPAPPASS
jgi:hypothetical protein